MKLEDMPTPEHDALFGNRNNRSLGDELCMIYILAHSLEQRLALAVAALRSSRKALCVAHYALLETAPCAAETCKQIQLEAVVSAELACRIEIKVTAETLAQIEEGK